MKRFGRVFRQFLDSNCIFCYCSCLVCTLKLLRSFFKPCTYFRNGSVSVTCAAAFLWLCRVTQHYFDNVTVIVLKYCYNNRSNIMYWYCNNMYVCVCQKYHSNISTNIYKYCYDKLSQTYYVAILLRNITAVLYCNIAAIFLEYMYCVNFWFLYIQGVWKLTHTTSWKWFGIPKRKKKLYKH